MSSTAAASFDTAAAIAQELQGLRDAQAELRARVDALRDLLESEGRLQALIAQSAARPPAPAKLVIDMAAVSPFAENLHPCEYSPAGTAFRWTGPGERVRLFLYADRSAAREIKVKVMAAVSEDARRGLQVSIDGQAVEHRMREHALLVTLPPSAAAGTLTELQLLVPGTAQPAAEGAGGDTRRLGIAISGIEVG